MILGRGKRALPFSIFLILTCSLNGQDGKRNRFLTGYDLNISFSEEKSGPVRIKYSIPEVLFNSLSNEAGNFFRLGIPGHILSTEPGKPEVPVFSRLITLPENGTYKIRVTEVKSKRIKPSALKIPGRLYPAQESQAKRDQQEKPVFRYDQNEYRKKGFSGPDPVSITPAGRARNISLANLSIAPVRYDPVSNKLEVITSMSIELIPSDSETPAKGVPGSAVYNNQLGKGVADVAGVIPGYTDRPVGMIILTDTAFRKQIIPFLEWKMQKGFRVKVLYRGAGLDGNTYSELKNTISGIWNSSTEDNPAPDYLLIIGDVNRIPYHGMGSGGQVTDMYYGEFDGAGDYIPEMYVGRIPAKDTSEVRSTLSKIIQYEKFEFADTNKFYRRAIATTGYDPSNAIFMDGQIRYSVENYLTASNSIDESHFYHLQNSSGLLLQKDSIVKLINKGTSFINYSGHGDFSGWLHLNLRVPDTARLKNASMYPIIISNACKTGQFNLVNSFGNRMVLEKLKGASGFIGGSNDTYWDEDYYWYVGLGQISDHPVYEGKGLGSIDKYFHTHGEEPSEWYSSLGQINYAGNMSVSSSTSRRKKYYWEVYNVIGDPSMVPFIGEPRPFSITLPDTLPNGIRNLSFIAEPFTYVAVSHFDTLWDASFAGASGAISLEMPGLSADSCLFVMTGQNRIPVIKKVFFSPVNEEFLNLDSTGIDDNEGNGNSKADYKENIFISLSISNLGNADADSVYIKLTSDSPFVDVQNDSVYIGTIVSGTAISVTDRLGIRIENDVPDMGIADLSIIIGSNRSVKRYIKEMPVHAPDLHTLSLTIDDAESGNGDFIADPGENFNLVFKVRNDGTSDASGNFTVTSHHQGLTIIQPTVVSGLLKSGETTGVTVPVIMSGELASGTFITLSSLLSCDPFNVSKDFTIRAGKTRESFEAASFNVFPWINLSSKPWLITESSAYEGNSSARSGMITHNQSTSLKIKTYYSADDTLKFLYKVSSEASYDHFTFSVNGKEMLKKSGEIPWTIYSVTIPEGLNLFEWKYSKDGSDPSATGDCVNIDMIDFTSLNTVNYIQRDLNLARIDTPFIKTYSGQATVRVKVTNTGRDTINGFDLAYSLNNRPVVQEFFDSKVYPSGDTVAVTFKTRIDLSRLGIYNLSIYGRDNDDDYLLNDTLRVEISNTEIQDSLRIFPNPFTGKFTIFINSKYSDMVTISITDTKGSVVYTTSRPVNAGVNNIEITDAELKPSLYFLSIRGSRSGISTPVIRLRE